MVKIAIQGVIIGLPRWFTSLASTTTIKDKKQQQQQQQSGSDEINHEHF
jgi:hypothetical protein